MSTNELIIDYEGIEPLTIPLGIQAACPRLVAPSVQVPTIGAGGHSTFSVVLENPSSCAVVLGAPTLIPDDGIFHVGSFSGPIGGNSQAVITVHYDPLETNKHYHTTATYHLEAPCKDDSVVIVLDANTPSLGAESGCVNSEFALTVPRPNPTGGRASVRLTIPSEGECELSLIDIAGKTVRIIASGLVSSGEHDYGLDLNKVPNGAYTLVARFGNFRLTREVVVQR